MSIRVLVALISALCVSTVSFARASNQLKQGLVTRVSDGDTIHFRLRNNHTLKVRMVGIDTPELHIVIKGGIASQGYWGEAGARPRRNTWVVPENTPINQVLNLSTESST